MLNNRLNLQTRRLVALRSRTIFLILFFLAFSTLAREVTQASSLSKRTVVQTVSKEEMGRFRVLRKIAGWRLSSLGLLYYANYIHNGIAIHGSPAMAVYHASHRCIRLPMFALKKLSELTTVGTEFTT
jgi:L,D-transpeptidase-like protein